jgi:hypothetical protein
LLLKLGALREMDWHSNAAASLWRDLSRFADTPQLEERRRFPA